MIPKIKIPKAAFKFILDKTADFLVNRLSQKVNGGESKSIQLSADVYEREIRRALEELKDSVQNLEAVVYQGKRLLEMSLCELSKKFEKSCLTNINVYGDVSITLNLCYVAGGIQIDGRTVTISNQELIDILNSKAYELFDATETESSTCKSNSTAIKFSNIISKRNEQLMEMRKED